MLLLVLAAALPLVWPTIPPLTDLPGHMARYKVALDIGQSPYLSRYFEFHWALFGNLGVDLLVMPLARAIGLEPAVKLIVMAIPPLTVAGMLWVAREVHGRVPPTALFALPLAFAYPFQFGFVNFTLSVALMFLGIGLWLRLGRLGRLRLRAALFLPFGFVIFLAHSVGWGMLGLAIFAIEAMAARQNGATWLKAGWAAALACLPLAPPVLLMADWWTNRTNGGGGAGNWRWDAKVYHLLSVLRNTSQIFDILSATALYILVWHGIRKMGLRFDARLGFAGLVLFAAFLALPGVLMGAAYADMRLAAYALGITILALTPTTSDPKWPRIIAVAGIAFCALRLGVQTWTYWTLDRGYQAQSAALDHLPKGSSTFVMANVPCMGTWNAARLDHFGQLAVVRREAFANGQWPMPGGRLLGVRYPQAPAFTLDPSQMLQHEACRQRDSHSLDYALKNLPRPAFDYLWLIDLPRKQWPRDPGLSIVWSRDNAVLYRIRRLPMLNHSAASSPQTAARQAGEATP
nr:hypothetical protein [Sphingomonas laterariae]